jgi:S1-C subfamily serine protease
VLVLKVTPRSTAEEAGLRGVRRGTNGSMVPGDVIVAVDGRPVQTVAQLFARLDHHQVGDAVRLSLLRDGRKLDVAVTLQAGGE